MPNEGVASEGGFEESRPAEGAGAGAEAPAEQPAPAEQSWSLRREDFESLVRGVHNLYNVLPQELFEPPEPEYPEDPAELSRMYTDQQLQQIYPTIQMAQQQQGEKRFNDLLDSLEKDPNIGKLSEEGRKAAMYAATSLLHSTGDPIEAVRQGALWAASFAKTERESGANEFKDSLKRPRFSDPGVSGPGESAPGELKTFEDVMQKWAGQEEV